MKRIRLGLFGRVILAIGLGALVGMVAPDLLVRTFKTFGVLFGQLLRFIIPLLILGFITPAIADVGKGAGKLLLTVMLLAYASTVASGVFAYSLASVALPHWLPKGIGTAAAAGKEFLPFITLKIPPVCDVMTALALSFLCGTTVAFTGGSALRRGFEELGAAVRLAIDKVIVPLLPVYIFTMICEMAASGKIGSLIGSFVKVIGTGVALSVLYLIVEYAIVCLVVRKNPFRCLWNLLPAYLTGFSISSSAPVIPITLAGAKKCGVSDDIADFVIPLCANVHMPGSVIKMATCLVGVSYMTGFALPPALYVNFVLMQAVSAVAAPGVATGVLMASVGLLDSIVGFSQEQVTLLMSVYLALDGYGAACSVTADGALALFVDRFFGKGKGA